MEIIASNSAAAPDAGGPGGAGHGQNTVTVTLNQERREVHRGSYTTAELKAALNVDLSLDLDVVEDGTFRTLGDGDRLVVREGMVFISHVRQGGSA